MKWKTKYSALLLVIFILGCGNFNSIHAVAEEYDIPLIVYASSSKTDAGFPKELNPWNPWYFKKVLKNDNISKQADSTFFG